MASLIKVLIISLSPESRSTRSSTLFRTRSFPLTLYLSQSQAIYKFNFKSAKLQAQFTTAIYKLRSTTGQMPALVHFKNFHFPPKPIFPFFQASDFHCARASFKESIPRRSQSVGPIPRIRASRKFWELK
jgi:hypothetical protein